MKAAPTIVSMKLSVKMRYFWLKYVGGVKLSKHCAECLVGPYSRHISPNRLQISDTSLDEFPAPKAFYLCGVASPYRWSDNFHLAFIHAPGYRIEVERQGVAISVSNGYEIEITGLDPRTSTVKHVHDPAYNTCRNWQFANQLESGLVKPPRLSSI